MLTLMLNKVRLGAKMTLLLMIESIQDLPPVNQLSDKVWRAHRTHFRLLIPTMKGTKKLVLVLQIQKHLQIQTENSIRLRAKNLKVNL